MNKTLAALVLGAGILGAGCFFEPEKAKGYIWETFDTPATKAAEAKGWDYLTFDRKSYGRNPLPCEQLSEFGKETLIFPVKGVKENNIVLGRMCCLGYVSEGNFVTEYCMLLEEKAEAQ